MCNCSQHQGMDLLIIAFLTQDGATICKVDFVFESVKPESVTCYKAQFTLRYGRLSMTGAAVSGLNTTFVKLAGCSGRICTYLKFETEIYDQGLGYSE